jgi:hypothetical protein
MNSLVESSTTINSTKEASYLKLCICGYCLYYEYNVFMTANTLCHFPISASHFNCLWCILLQIYELSIRVLNWLKCQKEEIWAIPRRPAKNGLSLPMNAFFHLNFYTSLSCHLIMVERAQYHAGEV